MTDEYIQSASPQCESPSRFWLLLRIVLYFFTLFLAYVMVGALCGFIMFLWVATGAEHASLKENFLSITPFYICLAVVTVVITMVFVSLVDKRLVSEVGLCFTKGWSVELIAGIGLGLLAAVVVLCVHCAAGWTRILGIRSGIGLTRDLVWGILLMLAVAVLEETMMRGYVLRVLKLGFSSATAIIASSVMFGVVHVLNPEASLLGVLGTTVAGLVLGYAYIATHRLWFPIGFHFSWNTFLGPVFGFPVSGVRLGGVIYQTTQETVLWTGGQFGPEAGLTAMLVLIACVVPIYLLARRRVQVGSVEF